MKCTPWILIFLCQAASLRAACAAHMRSPTEEAATDRLLNIRDTHGEEMFYFDIPEIKHLPKTLRHRSERTLHTVQSQTHGRTTAVNATPQIIGGTYAKEGQYPYFASVAPSSHWLCGASLVAPDMLLTAGHCAVAFKKGAIVKAMVEASTTAGGVAVKVTKQILYPGWTSFEHDDLLFLEIDPPIFDVDPLQLNFETTLPVNGESLEIIGFGKTGDLSGISPRLKQAQVSEVPYETCVTYYGSTLVQSQHICVWNVSPFATTCQGDSGGPLLGKGSGGTANTMLSFGVLSFGMDQCSSAPAVFTRLSGYKDFLTTGICSNSGYPPTYLNCGSLNGGAGGSGGVSGGGGSPGSGSNGSSLSCHFGKKAYIRCLKMKLSKTQTRGCVGCVNNHVPKQAKTCYGLLKTICVAPSKCPCSRCASKISDWMLCASGCGNLIACSPSSLQINDNKKKVKQAKKKRRKKTCSKARYACNVNKDCCEGLVCRSKLCMKK